MKRNILARRAASAALAACMMFSLSAPALAASTDALLQQSTAAKSAVSVLDEENDMMTVYQMDLNYGSIRVYIGDGGKQYVQQGDNEAQQKDDLQITTDGSPTTNTLTIQGGDSTAAKVTLSNVNIETTSDAAVSVSGNVGNRPGMLGGSNITINGGDVKAYGGSEAAGIGGGLKGNGKDITINGGTIHAESGGGEKVAAIGGGRVNGVGKNIQITGGNVTVKSGTGVWIGGKDGEIGKDSLTGTVTYLNGSGNVVDEIVQDFDIIINGQSVNSKNYNNILGGTLCYDIEEKTLKLKDGKSFEGALTITAPEDVSIDLEADASHVVNGDLTVDLSLIHI